MESWNPSAFVANIVSQNVALASVISSACFGLLAGYYYYRSKIDFWRKRNVKGPEPRLVFGNLLTLLSSNRMKVEREWVQKYGKVYGIYQGTTPRLIIADPELVQQVFIKDFDVFPNHHLFDYLNKYQREFLFFIKDEHWKRVRVLLSPTFTSAKIKKMYRFMDGCSDELLKCITEQLPDLGERAVALDVKELYSLYTLDTIATCCYGLKINRSGGTNLKAISTKNQFVSSAMKVMTFSFPRLIIAAMMPAFILKYFNFATFPESNVDPLARIMETFIKDRRTSTKKFDDYLQLLLDARINADLELNETDLKESHHACSDKESLIEDQRKLVNDLLAREDHNKTNVLTDHEVLTSATLLLAVGLETTASLLSHVTYALAFHKVVQARLYEEVMKIAVFDEHKKSYTFEYETLTSCTYLDSVISETLRCLPPILITDRKSTCDHRIEKYNIDLPAGTMINIAINALHNDPDLWREPDRFNPDRFMPENRAKIVPGSYCPFGMGPRHCLGMRFSLTETKLALAKTLTKFRFEPAPHTLYPPEPKLGIGLNDLKQPIVRVVVRS